MTEDEIQAGIAEVKRMVAEIQAEAEADASVLD